MANPNSLMVYSPQRSALTGRRTQLPEQYGFRPMAGVSPMAATTLPKAPKTVEEMIYAAPSSDIGGYGGGAMGLEGGDFGPGQIGGPHAGMDVNTSELVGGPFSATSPGKAALGFLSFANPATTAAKLGLNLAIRGAKGLYSSLAGPSAEAEGEARGADTAGFIAGMDAAAQGKGGYFDAAGPDLSGSEARGAGPAGPGATAGLHGATLGGDDGGLGLAGIGVGVGGYGGEGYGWGSGGFGGYGSGGSGFGGFGGGEW